MDKRQGSERKRRRDLGLFRYFPKKWGEHHKEHVYSTEEKNGVRKDNA
ncbi:MAG: hypothetical protein ABH858_07390 [Candidatus Omnitrophota bacterium]